MLVVVPAEAPRGNKLLPVHGVFTIVQVIFIGMMLRKYGFISWQRNVFAENQTLIGRLVLKISENADYFGERKVRKC
jgi:hypothetical protein